MMLLIFFFCDLTWPDLTWIVANKAGIFIELRLVIKTKEPVKSIRNLKITCISTIPVKVIMITRQNSEVFYKQHIYVCFFLCTDLYLRLVI